jgi:hypothetical protein
MKLPSPEIAHQKLSSLPSTPLERSLMRSVVVVG